MVEPGRSPAPPAPFRTRFAPSPTGRLHLGHAYAALQAWGAAEAAGGTCLLRIEDIDTSRCKPEYETGIYEDLRWLGLSWPEPVRRQSDHLDAYAAALERLRAMGLAYPCAKSRAEIAAETGGESGVYLGPSRLPDEAETQAMLASGKPVAWRLSMARAREHLGPAWDDLCWLEEGAGPVCVRQQTGAEPGDPVWKRHWVAIKPHLYGDPVLARKDIGVSYMLAVVVDDAAQAITHVVRGRDLYDATHAQILLQALLGLPHPAYRHHALLLAEDGKKFAKSDRSKTLEALREEGVTPADLPDLFAQTLEPGWPG